MDIVNVISVMGFVAAFGVLVALMERTHRRTVGLSPAPFGSDVTRDSDIRRTRHELSARPQS